MTNRNVLTIQTVQIAPFRTLMTALKDILLETNISFQKDGIRIINMDKSHTILAHLFLGSKNFELYDCQLDKIVIGVNMFHLFKLINTIDNDDTLTIYIDQDDYSEGIVHHLGLKFENGDIKQCKIQKLRLIEPEGDELEIPDVLIFKCRGQFAEAEIRRTESDGNMEFVQKQDSSKIIQGEFSLKNLSYFIKCTNLCSQIEMYLENNLPLVVKYNVASLGSIRLCLAPLPAS
jgi:proliferating cell nuclear antigen